MCLGRCVLGVSWRGVKGGVSGLGECVLGEGVSGEGYSHCSLTLGHIYTSPVNASPLRSGLLQLHIQQVASCYSNKNRQVNKCVCGCVCTCVNVCTNTHLIPLIRVQTIVFDHPIEHLNITRTSTSEQDCTLVLTIAMKYTPNNTVLLS